MLKSAIIRDMENLTDPQLLAARFFVRHEVFLRRLGIFTLFFVDLILIYTLALRLTLYLNGELAHQRVLKGLQENSISLSDVHTRSQSQPLRVAGAQAVSAGQGKVDVIAEITNPNARLLAKSVAYRLIVAGTPQQTQTTFVLPGEVKDLLFFGVASPDNNFSFRVDIVSTSWQRVDLSQGRQEILRNIEISDLDWGSSNGGFKVSGQATNNSGRGFWSLGMPIEVRQGSQAVGLNYVTLLSFKPGESRTFEANWQHPLSRVTSADVQLEANVYDDATFMPGGASLPDPSGLD